MIDVQDAPTPVATRSAASAPTSADAAIDDAKRARLAQLQQRRSGGRPADAPTRARPAHPAQGGRIVAAGLGMATMLGLVGAFGLLARHEAADQAPPTPDTAATGLAPAAAPGQAPVVVVVHHDGSPATTSTLAPVAPVDPTAAALPSAEPTPSSVAGSGPIVLTAQPQVIEVPAPQTVSASPAAAAAPAATPVARTNGSR